MPCTHDSESPTASMKPCKLKSVDAGSHGPLSQWLGQWWSTVLWAWGWLEQWEHDVTWVLPWAFPTEVWQQQTGLILIPQQNNNKNSPFLLVFSGMRWYWDLKIPVERRNIEFQNIEKQTNSIKRICHLRAVKAQWILYNLFALCLCACCINHARKFGTQLAPLSRIQSSNAC